MAPPERSEPVSVEEEEQRIELLLAQLLRVGVLLAASLVLLGGIMYLVQSGGQHPDYARFTGESTTLRSPLGVLSAAIALQPLGLIQLGVLVLIVRHRRRHAPARMPASERASPAPADRRGLPSIE